MTKLKAYEVRDDYEGHCVIRFATSNAAARREGAAELGIDWESVESCRRAPQFDAYSPGPVPERALLQNGWWFECHHCGRRVSNDMSEEEAEEGEELEATVIDKRVYCSASCAAIDSAKKRANAAAKAALVELFEAKFPGATITRVHVYGEKLEPSDAGPLKCCVDFMFPGGVYPATWVYGEDNTVRVPMFDVEAFKAWRDAA